MLTFTFRNENHKNHTKVYFVFWMYKHVKIFNVVEHSICSLENLVKKHIFAL